MEKTEAIPVRFLRHSLIPRLILGLLVLAYYANSPNFRWSDGLRPAPFGGDFLQDWIGGWVVSQGEGERLYDSDYTEALQHDRGLIGFDWDESKIFPMVYPPYFYVVVSPLSRLPYRTAACLWAALMTMCALAAAVVSATLSSRLAFPAARGTRPWPVWSWLLLLLFVYPPLVESLVTNQKGTLCWALFAGTYLLLRSDRPRHAGLLFGLLVFKPQLVIVVALAMLLKRQWAFMLGFAVSAIGFAMLAILLKWTVLSDYLLATQRFGDYVLQAGYDLHEAHCLNSFFSQLLADRMLARTGVVLAGGCVIALLARTLAGAVETSSRRFAVQFSMMVFATVLLSPHLYTYDLTVLLLPMVLLGTLAMAHRQEAKCRMLLGSLVLLFACTGISELIAQKLAFQLSVPLLLVVMIMTLKQRDVLAVAPMHMAFVS